MHSERNREADVLVDALIGCCSSNQDNSASLKKSLSVLLRTAQQWNDSNVFVRAAKGCGVAHYPDLLTPEQAQSALQSFPWSELVDL